MKILYQILKRKKIKTRKFNRNFDITQKKQKIKKHEILRQIVIIFRIVRQI